MDIYNIDNFIPLEGGAVKKPEQNKEYPEWNSYIIQIPENLIMTRTYSKKGVVSKDVKPLTNVTKNVALRTFDGEKIRAIRFVMDEKIKRPEIVKTGEDWGYTKIKIPEDMLYTTGKNGQLERIKQTLTSSKMLSRAMGKKSIELIPSPANKWKVWDKMCKTKPFLI
jgi:hypothetical protein